MNFENNFKEQNHEDDLTGDINEQIKEREMWKEFHKTPFGCNVGELISAFKASFKTKAAIAGAIGITLLASCDNTPITIENDAQFSSLDIEKSQINIPENIQIDVRNIKEIINNIHDNFTDDVRKKIEQYGIANSASYSYNMESSGRENKYNEYSNANAITHHGENIYFTSLTNSSYVQLKEWKNATNFNSETNIDWTSSMMQQKAYFLEETMLPEDVVIERITLSINSNSVETAIMDALEESIHIYFGENGSGISSQDVNFDQENNRTKGELECVTKISEGFVAAYDVQKVEEVDSENGREYRVTITVSLGGQFNAVQQDQNNDSSENTESETNMQQKDWINPDTGEIFKYNNENSSDDEKLDGEYWINPNNGDVYEGSGDDESLKNMDDLINKDDITHV